MAWNHRHLHDHRLKPKTHSGIASPFGQVYIFTDFGSFFFNLKKPSRQE